MKSRIQIIVIILVFAMPGVISAQNARQYYKTGLTFVEAGNHKDAIEQFTNALLLDPEYTQAYVERARSYEAGGDLTRAVVDLERALIFEQNEPELFFEAARINFALGKYSDALLFINKCTSLDRKYGQAYELLARIQLLHRDYSGSLISINKALAIKDNAERYFLRGQVSEKLNDLVQAEADYETAVSKHEFHTGTYLALAALRLRLNKTSAALESCNALLSIDPNNKNALLIRSRIYARLTEYTKAIDDVSKILAGNTENKEMYLVRGNYYQEFTQHQNAINDFSKALLIDPKFSEAVYKRAYSFEQVGDFESAIKDYENLTRLSSADSVAQDHLSQARNRLFELNRESEKPEIILTEPLVQEDSSLKIAKNKNILSLQGKVSDESEIKQLLINQKPVRISRNATFYEFTADIDITINDFIVVQAIDVYENSTTNTYPVTRTEIDAPVVAILAPYASDNGEIYLDTDNTNLYIEGNITDESLISSILIDSVTASFNIGALNPGFSATINVANKNKFTVTATDHYGNNTTKTFNLNREGISLLKENPMGRTWVIFIENSNYETFPSLDGPSKDITLMRSALSGYDIHKVIHKQDMNKKEMERFFSIELRDLIKSNQVNSLLLWYAGHGEFRNETGYWIPVDARRDDEFTFYNLNALRASLQSYINYITHSLVITDACESGTAFYQASRETPRDRDCNDWNAVKFKSSQVLSSAGYEQAADNSVFTQTFANILSNNPNACVPIDMVADKVRKAMSQTRGQEPKFGKITGLQDEDGTFFFMSKSTASGK